MFLTNLYNIKSKNNKPNLKVRRGIFGNLRNPIYPIAVWVIAVGLAFYPIYIFPLYHPEKFSEYSWINLIWFCFICFFNNHMFTHIL